MRAANDGRLKHSTSENDFIVYELLVNMEIYDFSKKSKKIRDQDNPGYEGDRHFLTIRISDTIADKPEGLYTDVITGVIKAK